MVIVTNWNEEASDKRQQEEEGMDRAISMFKEGYVEGQLIYEEEEECIYGWWSVKND